MRVATCENRRTRSADEDPSNDLAAAHHSDAHNPAGSWGYVSASQPRPGGTCPARCVCCATPVPRNPTRASCLPARRHPRPSICVFEPNHPRTRDGSRAGRGIQPVGSRLDRARGTSIRDGARFARRPPATSRDARSRATAAPRASPPRTVSEKNLPSRFGARFARRARKRRAAVARCRRRFAFFPKKNVLASRTRLRRTRRTTRRATTDVFPPSLP